jgi:hypothetical protein
MPINENNENNESHEAEEWLARQQPQKRTSGQSTLFFLPLLCRFHLRPLTFISQGDDHSKAWADWLMTDGLVGDCYVIAIAFLLTRGREWMQTKRGKGKRGLLFALHAFILSYPILHAYCYVPFRHFFLFFFAIAIASRRRANPISIPSREEIS